MTKEELIAALIELERLHEVGDLDPEETHSKADSLLLEYIGDKQITDAFDAIEKWYA